MKKLFIKSISILLLVLVAFFMLNIFMPNVISVMPSDSGHDKCFSQQCGPVQHLFHSFIFLDFLGVRNIVYSFTVLLLLLSPLSLAYPPKTPPPRIALIKN